MPNIENLLKKAMQEGKFDNLPGKGKPLPMDKINPHADPEWELAYGMLKDAGYSLPWIETFHEIGMDLEAARKDLRIAWCYYQEACAKSKPGASAEWERSQKAFRDKLEALNKRIRDYNLQVPAVRFQRPAINFDSELQKITGALG